MSEAIAAKLDEARALIEKGWTKHLFHDGGCYCAVGALSQVTTGQYYADMVLSDSFDDALVLLTKVARIQPDARTEWQSLSDWNDAAERTQAEVVEAFRKAADLARREKVETSALGMPGVGK